MRLVWQEAKLVGGRMVLVVPLGWELVFGVKSVGEIDSTNTAVGVDLDSKNINRD